MTPPQFNVHGVLARKGSETGMWALTLKARINGKDVRHTVDMPAYMEPENFSSYIRKNDGAEYTILEAGACLWEAMLELERVDNTSTLAVAYREWREGVGTCETRGWCLERAAQCSDDFQEVAGSPEHSGGWSFDWEWCPAWLEEKLAPELGVCVSGSLLMHRETDRYLTETHEWTPRRHEAKVWTPLEVLVETGRDWDLMEIKL